MLRNRPHQSSCNGGPPMAPNKLRLRESSHVVSTKSVAPNESKNSFHF